MGLDLLGAEPHGQYHLGTLGLRYDHIPAWGNGLSLSLQRLFSRTGSEEDEHVVDRPWALLPGRFPSCWGLLVVGPFTGQPLEGFLKCRGELALGMVYGWEQSWEDLKKDPGG